MGRRASAILQMGTWIGDVYPCVVEQAGCVDGPCWSPRDKQRATCRRTPWERPEGVGMDDTCAGRARGVCAHERGSGCCVQTPLFTEYTLGLSTGLVLGPGERRLRGGGRGKSPQSFQGQEMDSRHVQGADGHGDQAQSSSSLVLLPRTSPDGA
jgi:hypothetical protein